MTNQERIQARIKRDKMRKALHHAELKEQYGNMQKIFTHQHMFQSLLKRIKNTAWKGSVQNYISHFIVKNNRAIKAVLNNKLPPSAKVRSMSLYERGKRREIQMVDIESRIVQGCICDYALTPILQRTLIYDNPASVKGKGVSLARQRIVHHLRRYTARYKNNFSVLLYDFVNFFGNIQHKDCYAVMKEDCFERTLADYVMKIIRMYYDKDSYENQNGVGITLGSQISQNMALVAINDIDHGMKEGCKLKTYIRYMDDGFAAHNDKNVLWQCADRLYTLAEYKNMQLHQKKTRIVKASRGFVFLKIHYTITDTGRILRRMSRSSVIRMRRKLKKFKRKVDQGLMSLDDVYYSMQSWLGYARQVKSKRARKNMIKLYRQLFGNYRLGVTA